MMGRALLFVGLLATVGFVATAVLGYAHVQQMHVLVALASSLLLLFSHCWIVLFLIGTGRAIKTVVHEHGLEEDLTAEVGRLKGACLPWLALALVGTMATFFLGSGAYSNYLPVWVHHLTFIATLFIQLQALRVERRVLTENERLIATIDRRLAPHAA